jgi:hypothetical protein
MIPLKGTYPETPYQIKSSKSFQAVWDNLIDLFAQKGLSIKIIDKSSGLITSERSILTTTIEKIDGSLENPKAFIVVPQIYQPGPMRYVPIINDSKVTGEWNVRIKELEGLTIINVNFVNLQYSINDIFTSTSKQEILTNYKSTGVFERQISDLIK